MTEDIEKCHTWQFGVKMNLEEIKAKVTEIGASTATKHPKVLIGELCSVIKSLVAEVERITTPIFTTLTQDLETNVDPPQLERRSPQPPWPAPPTKETHNPSQAEPDSGSTTHIPGYQPRKGRDNTNAGDAK